MPARIGRYQLVGRLAKGGMAEAYLALSGELSGLRTLVVVKRILPHLSSNPQFVRMFFDEARIGALLDHPNIARVIEVGHDDDGYFFAMEPVQGKPLSSILRRSARRRRPLGHAHAAFIVGEAARGLGYAHALADGDGRPLNVVHRDVSPENIVVSFEGAVKVIDFGIASALGRLTETIVGGLKGKVEYMSPEQASGGVADRRSDVFALGIVLWEALCGRRLFRRATDLLTMRAITNEPIPRPTDGPARVAPRLERIVMCALEKAPEDRFQDAHEMSLLLHQYAYATDGFDPTELAAHVKQLFPAEHAGWRATASAALEIAGARPRKITSAFPLSRIADTQGPDTHGGSNADVPSVSNPTIELHKRQHRTTEMPPLESWSLPHDDPASDGGEPGSGGGAGGGAGSGFSAASGVSGASRGSGASGASLASDVTPTDVPLWARLGLAPLLLSLLLGAVGATAAFVALRARASAPAVPVVIRSIGAASSAAATGGAAPVVQPLLAVKPALPAASLLAAEPPTPSALPALAAPVAVPEAAQRSPERAPIHVSKPIVRKRPVVRRAAAVKHAPAPPHVVAPPRAPNPQPLPQPRPGWNDPFR